MADIKQIKIENTTYDIHAKTADMASQLGTNAGSSTQPVYFSNGIPTNTTYKLEKSVPSNAVFTDTTYTNATQNTAGLMSSTDKSKLDGIATGANNYTHPSTHAASMITEDFTHRFVTDEEKSTWNGKADASIVSALSALVGDKSVQTQIDAAIASKANIDLSNIDNTTFKAKVEASGFSSGSAIQILTWEVAD